MIFGELRRFSCCLSFLQINSTDMSMKNLGKGMSLAVINAVKPRKPLWDATHHMRKNANFLLNLWSEIAEELGENSEDILARWKHLRAYYAVCYKEHVKTGSRPTWQYYKAMSFLSNVIDKSLKDEEEQEALRREQEVDDEALNLDEIPGWNDETAFALNELNDPLGAISTQNTLPVMVIEPKEEPIDVSSESSSIDIQQAEIEISEPQEMIQPMKRRKLRGSSAATTSASSNERMTNSKPEVGRKRSQAEKDTEPETPSSSGWLAIERRKLELLEKEVAEEMNPDLSFFKSLLPVLKFFSEPQKLRIRMAINQIILREYALVKDAVAANGFQVKRKYHDSYYR